VSDGVRCVIDTAPLVAAIAGALDALGQRARREVELAASGRGRIGVPSLCFFEIAQLEERRRVRLRVPFPDWCDLVVQSPAFAFLPLELDHVVEARALPALKDPFDRLIAGTALALGVPLLSPDRRISAARRLRVLW
jgi:PIN domain nuclease of toxin-antitoxin system